MSLENFEVNGCSCSSLKSAGTGVQSGRGLVWVVKMSKGFLSSSVGHRAIAVLVARQENFIGNGCSLLKSAGMEGSHKKESGKDF